MNRYVVATSAANALGAASAETILSLVRPASARARLAELGVFFDGVTASRVPVLVELMTSDATVLGTATAITPEPLSGISAAAESAGAEIFTVEPTVLSLIKPFWVDPDRGRLILPFEKSDDIDQITTPLRLYLRCTAPDIVNVRAYMEFTEQH